MTGFNEKAFMDHFCRWECKVPRESNLVCSGYVPDDGELLYSDYLQCEIQKKDICRLCPVRYAIQEIGREFDVVERKKAV